MAKLFFINSVNNKIIDIKRNKFIVYKNKNICNNKHSLNKKKTNQFKNMNIKFEVFHIKNTKKCKVLKNNKLVYENIFYSKENFASDGKNGPNIIYNKSIRSSSYRGVSRNGNKWQVLLMNKKNKYYLGNHNKEIIAAKIYDIFAIKLRGEKATTNFFYNDEQIQKIKEMKFNNIK